MEDLMVYVTDYYYLNRVLQVSQDVPKRHPQYRLYDMMIILGIEVVDNCPDHHIVLSIFGREEDIC